MYQPMVLVNMVMGKNSKKRQGVRGSHPTSLTAEPVGPAHLDCDELIAKTEEVCGPLIFPKKHLIICPSSSVVSRDFSMGRGQAVS
jgi:hypothetical protein